MTSVQEAVPNVKTAQLCRLFQVPRSSFYYRSTRQAERWMCTLKEDHVQMSEYRDFWDAQAQIGTFIEEVYQRKRVHSKLGYLPPAVFEERWWATKASEMLLSGGDDALLACPPPVPVAQIALPLWSENATIA
jgi:hypothetical protein